MLVIQFYSYRTISISFAIVSPYLRETIDSGRNRNSSMGNSIQFNIILILWFDDSIDRVRKSRFNNESLKQNKTINYNGTIAEYPATHKHHHNAGTISSLIRHWPKDVPVFYALNKNDIEDKLTCIRQGVAMFLFTFNRF